MSNDKLNDVVLLERVDDVAIIRLNRPEKLNAFDVPTVTWSSFLAQPS